MYQKHNLARQIMPEQVTEEDAPPEAVAAKPQEAVPQENLDSQGWRMLLVEDQLSDVFLAEELLENSMPDYDWHILDRPSIASAITLLNHVKFDVVLLDLTLQDMEGIAAVEALRAAVPDVPIIVYSGSSNTDLLREAILTGAQFCIEKGRTDPKLVRAIIQCVLDPETA